ncbi:hypothetical protein RHMOL_Rhmol12G0021600 [Rhododendron molle]|uniref:Uncharacterized protein n=1 Tax=Rhododendron molle TaxID=49168 RepID=A0ACC0LDF7_RHOML|nr:hypothetical protein RHMOL_Rhmol12G0021600 [Rhododendron molle]
MIEEVLKTKIKGAGPENKVLIREKSEAMEIKYDYRSFVLFRVGLPYQGRTISCCVDVQSKIKGGIPRGPWGGNVGEYWAYKSDIVPIMQITLKFGEVIDSIIIKSRSYDDNVIGSSQRIGGLSGFKTITFRIDSSAEQLSSISLTYGRYNGELAIASLCFETNRDTYGPFGSVPDPDDPRVSIPIEDDVVLAGFHGRAGNFLNAIGIFVAPKRKALELNSFAFTPILKLLVSMESAELGRSVYACLYKLGHGPMHLWALLLSTHILLVTVLMMLEKHRMIFTCKDMVALRIFEYMQKTKTKADKLTFVGIPTACGNTVLLGTGQACFTSFVHDCF